MEKAGKFSDRIIEHCLGSMPDSWLFVRTLLNEYLYRGVTENRYGAEQRTVVNWGWGWVGI